MTTPLIGMPQGMEWLVILAIVVLVFGAAKRPDLARSSGQALRIFKSETRAARDDEEDGEIVDEPSTPEQRELQARAPTPPPTRARSRSAAATAPSPDEHPSTCPWPCRGSSAPSRSSRSTRWARTAGWPCPTTCASCAGG